MGTLIREVQFRADGRRLSGVALPYGVESPSWREVFLPKSVELADSVSLNLRHNQLQSVAHYPGGGLSFDDRADALHMSAEVFPIPAGDVALRDVRSGRLTGLSIEFLPLKVSRTAAGVKVVERARLVGLGLVSDPAYPLTAVEARRRRRYGSGRVLPNAIRACSCVGPDCDRVDYAPGAFDKVIKLTHSGERNVTAYAGKDRVLASTAAGSLTLATAADGGLEIELAAEVAGTPAGRDLAAAAPATMPVVRPLALDDGELTEYQDRDGVRHYSSVDFAAILINPAPAPDGWQPVELENPPRRRRRRSWL